MNIYSKIALTIVVYYGTLHMLTVLQKKFMLRRHQRIQATNKSYFYVVHGKEAANLLAQTKENMQKLLSSLPLEYEDKEIESFVRNLKNRFSNGENIKLYEIDNKYDKNLAYTLNKTQGFFLCLKQNDKSFANKDTILFLAIHELTHAGMSEYSEKKNGYSVHSPKFKKFESFLYQKAKDINLLDPKSLIGMSHCGGRLVDPSKAS
jgi:hypothetical protein